MCWRCWAGIGVDVGGLGLLELVGGLGLLEPMLAVLGGLGSKSVPKAGGNRRSKGPRPPDPGRSRARPGFLLTHFFYRYMSYGTKI